MTSIVELPWLLPAPVDFRNSLQNLEAAPPAEALERVLAASKFALDNRQLGVLARTAGKLAFSKDAPHALTPFRLGVLGSATTQLLAPPLTATALRYGVALSITEADFGQLEQEAFDPAGMFATSELDAILLVLDDSFLASAATYGGVEDETAAFAASTERLASIVRGLAGPVGRPVIITTIVEPDTQVFGSLERSVAGTLSRLITNFNAYVHDYAAQSTNYVLDFAHLASVIGTERWRSPNQWFTAKLPFDQNLLPVVSEFIARLIAAITGKSKKVLVLDLDNTLWGGVVGDDGVNGIKVGLNDALGEAHLALQRAAKELKNRGVVLAVASKNEDAAAREPFLKLPDMALELDDFAVFQANWEDKASNLQKIAEILDLGLESFVFVDDTPTERALVRQELPQVAVPELPDDPSDYVRILKWAGYFETVNFTSDDSKRAEQYRANAARSVVLAKSRSLEEFLETLNMVLAIQPFDEMSVSRITQLINKTNQFNLTTKRYTEAEVTSMISDSEVYGVQARLEDKFGDNGMVSVVICREIEGGIWDIDTWLMSCRVLKRKVEFAIMNEIVAAAKAHSIKRLTGSYIPTAKNAMVREFFAEQGFEMDGELENGGTRWCLELADFEMRDVPLRVEPTLIKDGACVN